MISYTEKDILHLIKSGMDHADLNCNEHASLLSDYWNDLQGARSAKKAYESEERAEFHARQVARILGYMP